MKRFYKTAGVAEGEGGFGVLLDGRPVRTPGGRPLAVPAVALAEAVAAEWAGQGPELRPATMPLTQLVSTALDRVATQRAAVVDALLEYAATDLLCYRADEPSDLVEREGAAWQPVFDWAMLRFDAPLRTTTGLLPIEQPPEALAALRQAVERCDDLRLTAMQSLTAACGSLLLALAVAEGRLSGEEAFAASVLDELYQAELWGEEEEAVRRRAALRADILAAELFISHCGP